MNFLLDTHALLWWLAGDPQLSGAAREAIAAPTSEVAVSAATVWEMVIKRAIGKLELPDDWFAVVSEEAFFHLPVTWKHAREVEQLPAHHADPFDRLLVAQARVEGSTLVTRDTSIRRYDVPILTA